MGGFPSFRDGFALWSAINKGLRTITNPEKVGPTAAGLARVGVVLLFLGCAGPVLFRALGHIPVGLAVLVALGLLLRIGLWLWRRR